MSITAYYAPQSSATRVLWALEELGLPYERVKLDLRAGDQRAPEYLAVNPCGKVPALVDDGKPLFESLAILIHLGETYGVERGLWPAAGTLERAEALSWSVWGTVTLGGALWRYFMATAAFVPEAARSPGQAELAAQEWHACLRLLDQRLAGRAWTVGGAFSLVDLANASGIGWGMMMIPTDLAALPHLAAWLARVTDRPAFAAARAA